MPPKRRWYIQAPHALRPYYTDLQTFLESNKHYTDLTVASFVFYPPKSDLIRPPPFEFLTDRGIASNAAWNTPFEPARLLLLQRNVTDASLSDLWEVPWGACKLMDPTILHSAKRVILDRTGLHTERLLKEIGKGLEFKGEKGLCLQLSFEIEIAEMVTYDFGVYPTFGEIPIKVDPGEHQDSVWVSKQDILDDAFPLVAHQSKDLILEAFRLRRKAEKQVRVQAILASRARKSTRYGLNYGTGSTDGSGSLEDDDDEEDQEEDEEEEEEEEEEAEEEEEEEEGEGEGEGDSDDECEGILEPHLRREFRLARESSNG